MPNVESFHSMGHLFLVYDAWPPLGLLHLSLHPLPELFRLRLLHASRLSEASFDFQPEGAKVTHKTELHRCSA